MSDEELQRAQQEALKAKKRRLRALIIGTVAAGGAFQLNGWQAQAHGNRSSHEASSSIRNAAVLAEDLVVTGASTVPNKTGKE
jgi:hypothetical protein